MKSVLLIMPFFNSYHTIIKDEIENMGYKVKVVRDSSVFVKLTHLRFLSERIYDFYMNTIWPILFKLRTKGEYDYLFVIKGQELTPALCDYLQNGCKTINSILYLWDSIAHNPKATKILDYFKHCYTFDDADSNKGAYKLEHIPLFYANLFNAVEQEEVGNIKYDFICIGSFKEERAYFLEQLENEYKNGGYSFLFKLYLPWNQYLRKILTSPGFFSRYRKYIFVRKMGLTSVATLTKQARIVVDVPDKIQSGLTMRTFEALGARKKLLTTNMNIRSYSFFFSGNIATNINEVDDLFINSDYTELDSESSRDLRSVTEWVSLMMSKLTS
ncbi:TPA: hypothetical protein ACKFUK_001054 [Citrobacter amalonaticus]